MEMRVLRRPGSSEAQGSAHPPAMIWYDCQHTARSMTGWFTCTEDVPSEVAMRRC